MNNIDKKGAPPLRVQDMLRKFEHHDQTNKKMKEKISLEDVVQHKINSKGSQFNNKDLKPVNVENRMSETIMINPDKYLGNVSVSERTKMFQESNASSSTPQKKYTEQTEVFASQAKVDDHSSEQNQLLGPLPVGPPPLKPPRNGNQTKNENLIRSIPVAPVRRKSQLLFERKDIEEKKSHSVQRKTENTDQPSSFLHDRFEMKPKVSDSETASSVPKRSSSVIVKSTNSIDEKSYSEKPKSPRQKSIQRPKVPPPRPPPPQMKNEFQPNDMVRSMTCNSSQSPSPTCNMKTNASENKLIRRSLSDENLYAVPSGINRKKDISSKGKSLEKSEYAVPYEVMNFKKPQNQELHYMSSPLPGFEKNKALSTPRSQRKMKSSIKEIVNQSFSAIRKTFKKSEENEEDESGESDSEVSVKDVQERIIYVQSFRKKPQEKVVINEQPKMFEYLLVIGLEWIDTANTFHPVVLSQFPKEVNFKQDKSLICQFCYPDSESWKKVTQYESEMYSFVLTDEKGTQTFAYCKRFLLQSGEPCTPIVFCLVCAERDFAFYSKILNELERRCQYPESVMNSFLSEIYEKDLPYPGESISFVGLKEDGASKLDVVRSTNAEMDSVEFSHLLKALDVENLIKAFSTILLERRVLFSASTLAVLTHCVQAMAALLYPFCWQHTLVPVIPEKMLDLCSMPTPFIMGVLSSSMHKVTTLPLEDVLIVDLDHSRIIREVGDETKIIPRKLQTALSTALTLANNMTDPTASSLTLMMCEAFVQMFVRLIGHFENHMIRNEKGIWQFEKESFCKAPYSRGIQLFLKWFCETQTFAVFIHDRKKSPYILNKMNKDGLFDRRVEEYRNEMDQMSQTFKGNVREIGKKVKDFGDKLRNIKAF